MPVEVLVLISSHLPLCERRNFSRTQFELATAVFQCCVLEAASNVRAADEIHTEALQVAGPVTPTETQAMTEIMDDAVTAVQRLKREDFVGSAALTNPSQLVVLAQRVVCTVLQSNFDRGTNWKWPTGASLDDQAKSVIRYP